MKKIIVNYRLVLQLFLMAASMIVIVSCNEEEDEVSAPPSISEVRNYASSPNDTLIQSLNTGQWVVVLGKNFSLESQVYFNGVPASVNNTLFTKTSMVVQVPSIPFESVPDDGFNVITVVNEKGASKYTIEIVGTPLITSVRNPAEAPNDTIVNSIVQGQEINIIGFNLKNATNIAFQGIPIDLAGVVETDSSIIVKVPDNLSGSDAALTNLISVTNRVGTGAVFIKIIGPPSITGVSFELPREGDQVYLYGNNFINIQTLTFAGAAITDFEVTGESRIGFISPALTQSGPVEIITQGGSFATAYKVNDIAAINAGGVGILGNMEWGDYFGYAWWGGSDLTSSDPNSGWPPYNANFPNGFGMYLELKSNVLNGGAGDDGTAIRLSEASWMPDANFNDPVSSWTLKFEIFVPNAWNGSTLCIKTNNGDYLARYEPWRISSSKTAPYSTTGWQTVTIPLSEFRLADGKGASVTSIPTLINNPSTGKTFLTIYLHNYGTSASTSFDGAFDNFRIVKR
jgi:hypothetical protein